MKGSDMIGTGCFQLRWFCCYASAVAICVVAAGCGGDDAEVATGPRGFQLVDEEAERASASSPAPARTPDAKDVDMMRVSPEALDPNYVPSWEREPAPEVVPYETTPEDAITKQPGYVPPNPETGKRSLPASFFGNDFDPDAVPKAAPPPKSFESAGTSGASTRTPTPRSGLSTADVGMTPTAPTAPPVASAGGAGSRPVDSAPGSTPGRPNPFGFPAAVGSHAHAGGAAGGSGGMASTAEAASGSPSPVKMAIGAIPKVRLFRGAALAQSLPTGTAMGFTMEYRFLAGFAPNAQYGWIIQPPRGNAVAIPVKLQQQGSLSHFVPQWNAMTGTYKLQLVVLDDKGKPHPMSAALDATYAY